MCGGNANEKQARFIELKDCQHVFEVNELIECMQTEPDSVAKSIELKKCPTCKTVIRRTNALNPFIRASLGDIECVKARHSGDPKKNRIAQIDLNRKVERILDKKTFKVKTVQLRPIYVDLLHETEFNKKRITKAKLVELTNKFELAEMLKMICVKFEKRQKSQQNVRTKLTEIFKDRLQTAAVFIEDFRNAEQQRDDIAAEVSFLQLMGDVIVKTCGQPFNDTGKKLLNDAFELASKCGSATESVRKEFRELVSEACEQLSGIGISSEDKGIVLRYMGFQREYWFKCPNGHIYCIGEYSECPECESRMDDADLSLNRILTTEMDDTTAPANPTNLII